jgi:hypothetical protein
MLVRSGALDVVVIDSVAALTPRAEIEGEMGDTHVGLQARLMSQALRKLTGQPQQDQHHLHLHQPAAREDRRDVRLARDHPGGRALKFYSSVRLDIRRIESIKDGVEVVGNRTRVKVVKNKVAPPFKQAEFDIMYGKGISREGSLLDIGVDMGFVKKSGAWYTYEGEQLGQGRENAKNFLSENPEIMVEVSEKVRPVRTFGCQMNEHDSERIAGLLEADGHVSDAAERCSTMEADVVVLNTCCIRENADNKLYGTSATSSPGRTERPGLEIVVGGCLAQKDRDLVPAGRPRRRGVRHPQRAPGADLLHAQHGSGAPRHRDPRRAVHRRPRAVPVGTAGPARHVVQRVGHHPDRLRQLTARSASCRPCAAPRSAARSTTSSPRSDARADGVTEVTLLGQNVNSYGRDLQLAASARPATTTAGCGPLFAELLRDLRWAPSTASDGSATPARTPRTCGPRPSPPWPRPSGVRAPAPAAAVGQRPRARG